MTLSRLVVSMWLVCMASLAGRAALAQGAAPDDVVAQRLAEARRTYEQQMTSLRSRVEAALKEKLDQASRPGKVDNEKIKQAQEELSAFRATGQWPDTSKTAALRSQAGQCAKTLIDEYARASASYTKLGKDALSAAISGESERFQAQSDIVPWGDNLLAGMSEEARSIDDRRAEFGVALDRDDGYRVEVRGKRLSDSGELALVLPMLDGKTSVVPIVLGKKGEVHVVLSVQGEISADVGVARPASVGAAAGTNASGERSIVLRATGDHAAAGRFEIESIRFKPVIKGAPEALAEKAAPVKKDRQETATRADPYQAGKSWRGKAPEGDLRVIRLVSRSGDRVTFEAPGGFAGSLWRISGSLNGTDVIVDDIDRIRNPQGHQAMRTRNPGGRVRINADGTLTMDCAASGTSGSWNGQITFKFSQAPPE